MADDPLTTGELAALTRRTETEFAIIKSELTTLTLKVNSLDHKLDALASDVRTGHAAIIEMLATVIAQGKSPDAP
ncbi:hypothetical protein [Embleya sp. AB8]|uniref:hypothetical protein n=1 Tax=Embleya sp. AB8 TaxID=3156304 RepID=UPI003C725486